MKKVVLSISVVALCAASCTKKSDPAQSSTTQQQTQEQTKQAADTTKQRGINIILDTTMKDTTIILQ